LAYVWRWCVQIGASGNYDHAALEAYKAQHPDRRIDWSTPKESHCALEIDVRACHIAGVADKLAKTSQAWLNNPLLAEPWQVERDRLQQRNLDPDTHKVHVCPCSSNADGCLRSDVVPDSRHPVDRIVACHSDRDHRRPPLQEKEEGGGVTCRKRLVAK